MNCWKQIAEQLGVDEIQTSQGISSINVWVRIGNLWSSTTIDTNQLEDVKNPALMCADRFRELVQRLKRDVARADYKVAAVVSPGDGWIDEARGEDLDRAASLVGLTREPEARQLPSRFAAVAEELKKL